MPELLLGLAEYFVFYNGERAHQSLSYKTPNEIYNKGEGGGAQIVDHFRDNHEIKTGFTGKNMGQRQSAATTQAPS